MKEDLEKKLRNFVLDALIAKSGQHLIPEVINQITQDIVIRVSDLLMNDCFKMKK